MLGDIKSAVLIGFVACLLAALVSVAASTMPPKPEQDASGYAASQQPGDHCKNPETFWQRTTCDPIAFFTFWLAVFTFVLTVAALVQLHSLHQANRAARMAAEAAKTSADSLVSSERAHLFVQVTLQSIQDRITRAAMVDRSMDGGHLGDRLRVAYVVRNFGKTPAILREINRALVTSVELPEEPVYSPPRDLPQETILAAGDDTPGIDCYMEEIVTVEQAREIAAGNCSIWLIGRVIYEDTVSSGPHARLHTEPFLYRYAGAGFNSDYREAYNRRT